MGCGVNHSQPRHADRGCGREEGVDQSCVLARCRRSWQKKRARGHCDKEKENDHGQPGRVAEGHHREPCVQGLQGAQLACHLRSHVSRVNAAVRGRDGLRFSERGGRTSLAGTGLPSFCFRRALSPRPPVSLRRSPCRSPRRASSRATSASRAGML